MACLSHPLVFCLYPSHSVNGELHCDSVSLFLNVIAPSCRKPDSLETESFFSASVPSSALQQTCSDDILLWGKPRPQLFRNVCLTWRVSSQQDDVEHTRVQKCQQSDVESCEQQWSAQSKHHDVQQLQHRLLQLLRRNAGVCQLLGGQRHVEPFLRLWVLTGLVGFFPKSLFLSFLSLGKLWDVWRDNGDPVGIVPLWWQPFEECMGEI